MKPLCRVWVSISIGLAGLMAAPRSASAFYAGLTSGASYSLYYKGFNVGTLQQIYMGNLGWQGGLFVGQPIGGFTVESGASYVSRTLSYSSNQAGATTASYSLINRSLRIPLKIYYHPGSVAALGIGGFYELPQDGSGFNNFGVSVGFRFKFHIVGRLSTFAEIAYLQGIPQDSRSTRTQDFEGNLGFVISIGADKGGATSGKH